MGVYLQENSKYEKGLLKEIPREYHGHFEEKLAQNSQEYWQTIGEMRAFAIFASKLSLPISDIDVPTIKGKDVDFTFDFEGHPVYVEVTGKKRADEDVARQGGNVGLEYGDMIVRSLKHALQKFLSTTPNILVIFDGNTTQLNLTSGLSVYPDLISLLFRGREYDSISGILVLHELIGSFEETLKFEFYENDNANNSLPDNLKILLKNAEAI